MNEQLYFAQFNGDYPRLKWRVGFPHSGAMYYDTEHEAREEVERRYKAYIADYTKSISKYVPDFVLPVYVDIDGNEVDAPNK